MRFAHVFKAGSGAEAVRQILEKIDLKKEIVAIERQLAARRNPSPKRSFCSVRQCSAR